MVEGELQKRKISFENIMAFATETDEFVHIANIDEAKKEFPYNPATQFKFKYSKIFGKKQAEQIVAIIEEAQKPYKDWGKKWLGGHEESSGEVK